MAKDPFSQYSITAFYHFTDRCNLPMIQEHGGLFSLAKLREMKMFHQRPAGTNGAMMQMR